MKKRNLKYKVFLKTTRDYSGNGVNEVSKIFLGYQYAVSETQAISRYAYNNGIKTYNIQDMYADGLMVSELVAELYFY